MMDGRMASPRMLKALAFYGLQVAALSHGSAWAVLRDLQRGRDRVEVAKQHALADWMPAFPTPGQLNLVIWKLGEKYTDRIPTPRHASLLLDAYFEPLKLYKKLLKAIDGSKVAADLDAVKRDVLLVKDVLPGNYLKPLYEAGKQKRAEVGTQPERSME